MKNSDANHHGAKRDGHPLTARFLRRGLKFAAPVITLLAAHRGFCEDPSDPILNLFLQKGFITESEAAKAKAEIEAMRTNMVDQYPASRWKVDGGIKSMEIFGDLRLRYEDRVATEPYVKNEQNNGSIDLERLRFALRLGLRGEANDDVYYGLRIETSSNPRSSWVTFGSSNPGPAGKSAAGLYLGEIYLGWRPEDWVDITLGKMPNPLYTSSMVWSGSLNPEGAAEKFKSTVGEADLFATFGQFLYADTNPSSTAPGFFPLNQNSSGLPFMLAWQAGVDYHLTKKIDLKVGPALYNYTMFNGGKPLPASATSATLGNPGYSETYVGQGLTSGIYGVPAYWSGYPNGPFDGYAANQTGINDLLVLEFPFELNVKLERVDLRWFGDYAQNLQGSDRANAAYSTSHSGYFAANDIPIAAISSPQTHDDKAYQIGFAIGSTNSLGLVNGTVSMKHGWEFRTYYQHIEQYALDPNLIDTDFFSGDENMEGIYTAIAYGFTDNLIGEVRYGHANRINDKLGTGGSGQDIPQMNPVNYYDLLQVDVTFRF